VNQVDTDKLRVELEAGRLPPLRNLAGGFSAHADQTNISYAQSGEVVRFLIHEYGPEQMSALLSAIQSGLRINPALQEVYGFDTDGLDNTWRASLGFASAEPLATLPQPRRALLCLPWRCGLPRLAAWWRPVQPLSRPPLPLNGRRSSPIHLASSFPITPTLEEAEPGARSCSRAGWSALSDRPGSGRGIFLVLLAPGLVYHQRRSRDVRKII
jgi:hypothetical protein